MKVTDEPSHSPCFAGKRYFMGETCQGRVTADLLGHSDLHYELFDGARWYTVPKEIFMLWVSAYNRGQEEGGKRANQVKSSRGGAARARKLIAEQRSEIGRKGAEARWGKKEGQNAD